MYQNYKPLPDRTAFHEIVQIRFDKDLLADKLNLIWVSKVNPFENYDTMQ